MFECRRISWSVQQDTDHLRTDLFKMQTNLDMGVKKNKESLQLHSELAGFDLVGPQLPMISGSL